MRLTKRKFILAGLFGAASLWGFRQFRPELREWALTHRMRLPEPAATGSLSESAMESLISLAEVLVDERELDSDERECVRAHVRDRAQNDPGYLTLYRLTVARFDRLAASRFAVRSREDRRLLAERSGLLDRRMNNREWLYPFGKEDRMIRAIALPDLIEGYYRSSAGWAVVGYSVFPGRCGDLKRYTRAES